MSAVRHPLPPVLMLRVTSPPCVALRLVHLLHAHHCPAPLVCHLSPGSIFGSARPCPFSLRRLLICLPSLCPRSPAISIRLSTPSKVSSLLARSSYANFLSLIIALPLFKECTFVRSARPCYPMGPFSDAKSHSFCGPISAHKKVPFSAKLPDHLVRANLTIWAHRVPGLPRAVVAVQSSPFLLRFPATIRFRPKNQCLSCFAVLNP